METKQLQIGFGALVPSIVNQLKKQKFKYNSETVKHFEKLRDCIMHLQFSGLINDKSREKAIQKLFTKVRQHVMQQNKLKTKKS